MDGLSNPTAVADPDSEAIRLAYLNGREWSDMSEYERADYRAEARKVECDCCGNRFPADEVSTIAAERAFGAQCETTVCDDCRELR